MTLNMINFSSMRRPTKLLVTCLLPIMALATLGACGGGHGYGGRPLGSSEAGGNWVLRTYINKDGLYMPGHTRKLNVASVSELV